MAVSVHAAETDDNTKNDKSDSLNVAKNFRRALLDALEQLEKDEKSGLKNYEQEDLDASDYEEIGRTKYGNKVRSNISKQESTVTTFSDDSKGSVFVHSFTHPVNDESSKVAGESPKTDIPPNEFEATTIKLHSKPTTDNFISASATSSTAGGSTKPATTQPSRELTAPATPKTPLTSPTPTVTTPVEEEDESKSKAEDVQFITAPLVAAFTVEQDDKGLPRKVIPIYGNKQSESTLQIQNSAQNLQATLEAKQRQLEQQLRILQEQKRQHEILLQRQSLSKEQLSRQNTANHNFQHDQNINLNVQNDLSLLQSQDYRQRQVTSDHNRINIPIPTQKDISTLRPTKEVSGTVVAFQPSIVFQPNSIRNDLNQKPITTFNNRLPQNVNTQFTQVVTQNSVPQFNQLQNTATRFNQATNQNPQTQFNSQNTVQQTQFNSQPVRQQTRFISQSSVPQFSQGNTQFGQFTQNFSPSFDQNQLNIGLPQRAPSQFNQGFITPSIELSHTLPQQRAPTQFNTGFSTLPVNQFNTGFNQVQSPFNHQQFSQNQALPIKSAVDFQKAISVPISDSQNFLTQQQIPNQVRENSFINNDQYLQDFFYRQRTLVPPPPRTNRVNRHEAQIGNFGINDFNQNNNFPQRFSTINYNTQNLGNTQGFTDQRNNVFNNRQPQTNQAYNSHLTPSNVDYRLKNLIYQSGLGHGRGQEDLNIVSKVLSLDHTGNYQNNFLFGESNVSERRIPFRQINKTFKT